MHSACFQDAFSSLVEVFAKYVLSPNSDIAGSKKALEASKEFLKETAALASKRRVYSCTVLPGPVSVQKFPVQTVRFFGTVGNDAKLFKECQRIPVS